MAREDEVTAGAAAVPLAPTDALEPVGADLLDRSLPRAERAVGLAVAGMRVATLVQMLPSVVSAYEVTGHRALCVLTWCIAAVGLVGTVVLSVGRRRPPGPAWVVADVGMAVALLLLGLLTVPEQYRTGSWIGFQGAWTIAVVCGLVGVRHRGTWLALLGTLVLARAAYLLPTVAAGTGVPTVVGELLTLLVLAPLAWFGTGVLYRIATDADRAREYAARLAREAEERRARAAIHNGAALLKLLVDQAAQDPTDSRTPSQVWVQAASEVNRMRAYLAGRSGPSGSQEHPRDLAAIVEGVATEFADLPLDVVPDLARGVTLGPEAADVATALRSLLINVRQHARATRVVLHAEEVEEGGGWAVTLHDDGVGFDPTTTVQGVGLRGLVVEPLADHGVLARVDSVPGLGTTVTLRAARTRAEEVVP